MTAISAPISMNTHADESGNFVDRFGAPVAAKTTRAFAAFFQSLLSLGLLPLLLWPTRWSALVDDERRDLLELVTWWRWRVTADDAADLDKIARGLRPRPILMVLPWLAVAFNFVLIATLLAQGDKIDRIWDLTFKHAFDPHGLDTAALQAMVFHERGITVLTDHPVTGLPLERPLYAVWMASLLLAYGCHWYAVRSHTVVVHSLVKWTNKLARQNQLTRIKNEALRVGFSPPWILAGIVLCSMHAWWGIPLVFAGALQQRYTSQSSPAIRMALAGQGARSGSATPCRAGPFLSLREPVTRSRKILSALRDRRLI